jgi:hypothetical protein
VVRSVLDSASLRGVSAAEYEALEYRKNRLIAKKEGRFYGRRKRSSPEP